MTSILLKTELGEVTAEPNGDVRIALNTGEDGFKQIVHSDDIERFGEFLEEAFKGITNQRETGTWEQGAQSSPRLILDLDGVDALSSGAPSKIVLLHRKAKSAGFEMVVENAGQGALLTLRTTKMDKLFSIAAPGEVAQRGGRE